MTLRTRAVAGLAEDVGKALLLFADRLRAEDEAAAAESPTPPGRSTSRVGGTQLELLEAVRGSGDVGLTTREAAEKADMHPNNASRALKGLADRGLVSRGDESPAVWRVLPAQDG